MKVLMTGGCGFIGSHIVDCLVSEGHDVVVVDDLSSGKVENMNGKAKLYVVDILSDGIENVFRNERPEVVAHHAAQISVPLSVKEPLLDARVNIEGTIKILDLAQGYGTRKFVFASSGGAIYGEADKVPTDEEYWPEPVSPYAIAKFAAEKYIRFFFRRDGLKYAILRYGNVYGPRQVPHGEAGVVAIFTDMLLAGRHPVVNHFPEERRGMVRDYCYVKDVARAAVLAAGSEATGIFNIGTGAGTHTLDLYTHIVRLLRERGVTVPGAFNEPLTDAARPGDIRTNILDVRRAKEVLGFEAAYDIRAGLADTIDWRLAGDKA